MIKIPQLEDIKAESDPIKRYKKLTTYLVDSCDLSIEEIAEAIPSIDSEGNIGAQNARMLFKDSNNKAPKRLPSQEQHNAFVELITSRMPELSELSKAALDDTYSEAFEQRTANKSKKSENLANARSELTEEIFRTAGKKNIPTKFLSKVIGRSVSVAVPYNEDIINRIIDAIFPDKFGRSAEDSESIARIKELYDNLVEAKYPKKTTLADICKQREDSTLHR